MIFLIYLSSPTSFKFVRISSIVYVSLPSITLDTCEGFIVLLSGSVVTTVVNDILLSFFIYTLNATPYVYFNI